MTERDHNWDDHADEEDSVAGHEWDDCESEDDADMSDNPEEIENDLEPHEAVSLLLDFMIQLLILRSTFTAREFCVICSYAAKAGLKSLGKYGVKPEVNDWGSRSGHSSRKVKATLDFYKKLIV